MEAAKGLITTPFGPKRSFKSRTNPRGLRALRADLHVHSRSTPAGHFALRGMPSARGDAAAIYSAARRRGMDLVTLTDVDTIEGCLQLLDSRPDSRDLFISEEITARDPRIGAVVPVLAYGISEAQHAEIVRLRGCLPELLDYLRSEGIAASLGLLPVGGAASVDLASGGRSILEQFSHFEIRNGIGGSGPSMERLLVEAMPGRRLAATAGSGAHGPGGVGRTFTECRANDRDGFLDALREGRCRIGGRPGSALEAAREQVRLLARGYRDVTRARRTGEADRRALARALRALPHHLSGLSLGGHALRMIRSARDVGRARRRFDEITVRRFQEKARSYARADMAAGTDAGV